MNANMIAFLISAMHCLAMSAITIEPYDQLRDEAFVKNLIATALHYDDDPDNGRADEVNNATINIFTENKLAHYNFVSRAIIYALRYLGAYQIPQQIFVARQEDQTIGFVRWSWRSSFILSRGLIYQLAVAQEHRGKGYGQALLERVFAQARELNIRTLYLSTTKENSAACTLYEKMGFETDGGEDGCPWLIYLKYM